MPKPETQRRWPEGDALNALPRPDDRVLALLMSEHEGYLKSYHEDKAAGERALTVLAALISATLAGLGLIFNELTKNPTSLAWLAIVTWIMVLGFGLLTLRRVIQRDLEMIGLLNARRLVRAAVLAGQPSQAALLPFIPREKARERPDGRRRPV